MRGNQAQPAGDRHRRPSRSRRGRRIATMRSGVGFTLLELLITVAVVAILATIAHGQYASFIERAKVSTAIADIATMEVEITRFQQWPNGPLPESLADIGRADLLDPWGRPYHYVNLRTTNKGAARRDRRLNPINSDYDLFSAGKNGVFKKQVSQKDSLDDVIRGRSGGFIGLAKDF